MADDEQKKPAPEAEAEAKAPEATTPEATTPEATKKPEPAAAAPAKEAPAAATATAEASAEEAEDEEKRPSQPSAEDLLKEDLGEVKIRRAKGSKNITSGIAMVHASFNNTKVCFTDMQGNVISWSSAGKCNFRGSRKSTAYAAQVVTQDAGRVAISHGMKEVEIRMKGPGMGRDSAVRAIQALGLTITGIRDVTPVPHNGCRPPKRRRV